MNAVRRFLDIEVSRAYLAMARCVALIMVARGTGFLRHLSLGHEWKTKVWGFCG